MKTLFFRRVQKLTCILALTSAPTMGNALTLCQHLLTQRTRLNAPALPYGLKFQAWVPGADLPDHQHSLGALEFYSSELGPLVVQSISGLDSHQVLERRRRLTGLLELTPFAGFVNDEEFKSVLTEHPIPSRLKRELLAPGVVHIVKRLPEQYLLFSSASLPGQLKEFLSQETLRQLDQNLEQIEVVFNRLHLTVEAPLLTVGIDGEALLLNFEAVRERDFREPRLRLTKERKIVEEALFTQ